LLGGDLFRFGHLSYVSGSVGGPFGLSAACAG
jgi:hypothetical protein